MNPPGFATTGEVRAFFRWGTRIPNSRAAVNPGAGPEGQRMATSGAGATSCAAGGRMFGNGAGRTSGPGGGGGKSAGRGRVVTVTGAGSSAGATPAAATIPISQSTRPNVRPMIGPRTRGNGSGRRDSGGRGAMQ